jgi:hypothetical protein
VAARHRASQPANGRRSRSTGRHRAKGNPPEAYRWLGAGALAVGIGAALAGGTGTAYADAGEGSAGPAQASHTSASSASGGPSTGSPSSEAADAGRHHQDEADSTPAAKTDSSSASETNEPKGRPHGADDPDASTVPVRHAISAAPSRDVTPAADKDDADTTVAEAAVAPAADPAPAQPQPPKHSLPITAPVAAIDPSPAVDTAEVTTKSDRIVAAKSTLAAVPSVDAFTSSALLVPTADALLGVPILGLGGLLSSTLSGLAGLTGGIPLLGPVLGPTVGVVSSTTVVVTGAAAILFGAPIVGFLNVGAGISSGFGDLALLTGNVPVAFGAKAFAFGFQTAAQGFMFFGVY